MYVFTNTHVRKHILCHPKGRAMRNQRGWLSGEPPVGLSIYLSSVLSNQLHPSLKAQKYSLLLACRPCFAWVVDFSYNSTVVDQFGFGLSLKKKIPIEFIRIDLSVDLTRFVQQLCNLLIIGIISAGKFFRSSSVSMRSEELPRITPPHISSQV